MKVTNPSLNLDAAAPLFVIINYQSPKFVRFIDKVWKQIWDCHPINKNMSTRILKFHFGIVTKLMISTLDDEKHVFLQKLNQCLSRGVHGVVQCDFGPLFFFFNIIILHGAIWSKSSLHCTSIVQSHVQYRVVHCSVSLCGLVNFGLGCFSKFWTGLVQPSWGFLCFGQILKCCANFSLFFPNKFLGVK